MPCHKRNKGTKVKQEKLSDIPEWLQIICEQGEKATMFLDKKTQSHKDINPSLVIL